MVVTDGPTMLECRQTIMKFRPQHFFAAFLLMRNAIIPAVAAFLVSGPFSLPNSRAAAYDDTIAPILTEFCYDCHGDGMDKGNVTFDHFSSDAQRLQDRTLWAAVLKNVRAELMPPAKKPRPSDAQVAQLERWIKYDVFGIDPDHPDPGRTTLRRLNRNEYQNTVRDLMGIEFKAYEEFPPDDTGYGFDNIADVLTVSPLLLEKYMAAAEMIVQEAVPTVTRTVTRREFDGGSFRGENERARGSRLDFYEPARVARTLATTEPGRYRLTIDASLNGSFDFDPGRCRLTVTLNGETLQDEEHKWQDRKSLVADYELDFEPGDHELVFALEPLVEKGERDTSINYHLRRVVLEGPLDEEHWRHPPNYERFFHREAPPEDNAARLAYAREIFQRFLSKAYRRPADDETVESLALLAEGAYQEPDKTFEAGIAHAMIAALSSPRFIFRVEDSVPASDPDSHPYVDQYGLASRLSYFFWSTMPDDELLRLAAAGLLRENLSAQAKRLMADPRSEAFVENFVGQWLQVRDIEGVPINERVVLARDRGRDREMEQLFARFRELRAIPDDELTPELEKELDEVRQVVRRQFRGPRVELDGGLRRAMRRETEMVFDHIVREDRSVIELLDSDYTFLNEALARHYGIEGVEGDRMRKVDLSPESPRGGVLTHGAVLVVTSNPTRTSPVKRGLFVLDYLLGTPAPPPPEDVPDLEEAEEEIEGHDPTLREALELHRESALCRSCHARMDPLGLALENFNALGMWRDQERGQDVDASGQLITGESFQDIRELKKILAESRRRDFYRCLTEKLLTYALGRGLEDYDVETVDKIVAQLELQNGRFSALLDGVIESAPFQKRRRAPGLATAADHRGEHDVVRKLDSTEPRP